MPDLFHCIYTSVQVHPLSGAEIVHLVQTSREKNTKHGLTGILLHVGDTFFQVLEGPRDVLEELYGKILKDTRHMHITRIISEPISRRYFADSSMSLATLSPAELANLLEHPTSASVEHLLSGVDEGRAKRLLRAFSDGRWRHQIQGPDPLGEVSA